MAGDRERARESALHAFRPLRRLRSAASRRTAYRAVKLGALYTALERVAIAPGFVQPLRVVSPARRRAQVGLIRPHDPSSPARIGFRERFRHELVNIEQCHVLEPELLRLVGELRLVACNLVPSGGTAEVTLTQTDSGVDLLLYAAKRPGHAALEVVAELAENCDLTRVVWRSPGEEILVVERRPGPSGDIGRRRPVPARCLFAAELGSRSHPS